MAISDTNIDTSGLIPVEPPMVKFAPPLDLVPVRSPFYRGNVPTTAIVNSDAVRNFQAAGVPSYRIVPPQPLTLAGSGTNAVPVVATPAVIVPQPPAPTVSQPLSTTPTGYQFTFLQVNIPTSLPPSAVISAYKVYRNSTNDLGSAAVVQTIHHNPANAGGPVVVQDVQAAGVVRWYWVSAVNVSGKESGLTPAQSGAVTSGSQLNGSGQLSSADQIAADGNTYLRLPISNTVSADLPYNASFDLFGSTQGVADGWTKDFEVTGSGATYSRSSSPDTGTYAQIITPVNGSSGGSIASQPFGVKPGAKYTFRCRAKSSVANPASMYFRVLWYSSESDFTRGSSVLVGFNDIVSAGGPTVSNTYQTFSGEVLAPSTAIFCRVAFYSWITGNAAITFDTVSAHLSTLDLDNAIVDGTSFARVVATDLTTNRLDFSKSLLNKQLDNIPDGTTYARPIASRINAGKPLIDFSEGIHLNKVLDNLADTSSFKKTTPNQIQYLSTTTGQTTASTILNAQLSVLPNSSVAFTKAAETTSTLGISWGFQSFKMPDGSTFVLTGGSDARAGLTASHTYFWYPYLTLSNAGGYGGILPSTGTDLADHGVAWTNPNNVGSTSSNAVSATVASGNPTPTFTNTLRADHFSFAIDSGASIVGVVVTLIGLSSMGDGGQHFEVNLVKGGSIVGTQKDAGVLTTSAATYTCGTSSDLWGTTLTPSDVNASNFGVAIIGKNFSNNTSTYSVRDVLVTVYFSGAATNSVASMNFAGFVSAADKATAALSFSDGRISLGVISDSTTASGTGSGGTSDPGGTCPHEDEKVLVRRDGIEFIIASKFVRPGDEIKGFSFTSQTDVWRKVTRVAHVESTMWFKVNGYLCSPCETVYVGGEFMPAFKAPGAEKVRGLHGNRVELTVEPDDQNDHSNRNYYLVGNEAPLLVHNLVVYS